MLLKIFLMSTFRETDWGQTLPVCVDVHYFFHVFRHSHLTLCSDYIDDGGHSPRSEHSGEYQTKLRIRVFHHVFADVPRVGQHRHDLVVVLLGLHHSSSRSGTVERILRSQMVTSGDDGDCFRLPHRRSWHGCSFGVHRCNDLSDNPRSKPRLSLPLYSQYDKQMESSV
jgi:hypothetical protein